MPSPPAAALVWDVDNVAPSRAHLASLGRALRNLVGAEAPRLAGAQHGTFRSCRTVLTDLGYQVVSGGRRPDGTDRVLLTIVRRLAHQGISRFLVASNDARFAQIAQFADLHVVTLTDAYVSGRLRAVARDVTVLIPSGDEWAPVSSPVRGPTAAGERRPLAIEAQPSPCQTVRSTLAR